MTDPNKKPPPPPPDKKQLNSDTPSPPPGVTTPGPPPSGQSGLAPTTVNAPSPSPGAGPRPTDSPYYDAIGSGGSGGTPTSPNPPVSSVAGGPVPTNTGPAGLLPTNRNPPPYSAVGAPLTQGMDPISHNPPATSVISAPSGMAPSTDGAPPATAPSALSVGMGPTTAPSSVLAPSESAYSAPTTDKGRPPRQRGPKQVQVDLPSSHVSAKAWQTLLGPLDLINCIKLESANEAFKQAIYSGQNRLVWDKAFSNYLYQTVEMNSIPQLQWILFKMAQKVGKNCRQLVLKCIKIPENHAAILDKLDNLEAIYFKFQFGSAAWETFFTLTPVENDGTKKESKPALPHKIPLKEMCLRLGPNDTHSDSRIYLPKSFPAFMEVWGQKLESIEVWRAEHQHSKSLLAMPKLKVFSLFCDMLSIGFFDKFTERYARSISELYVHWETPQSGIDIPHMSRFMESLQRMRSVRVLELKLQWSLVKKDDQNMKDLRQEWAKHVSTLANRLSSVEKLCIDVRHSSFTSPIKNCDLTDQMVRGFKQLSVLRIVLADAGSFPLVLHSVSVDTLELCFTVFKINYLIWDLVPTKDLYPKPLIKQVERGDKVRALKLIKAPPLNMDLLTEIAQQFARLEMLYISASVSYNHNTMALFEELVSTNCLPRLRVFELSQKVNHSKLNPDVQPEGSHPVYNTLANKFIQQASANPDKQYLLDIGDKRYFDARLLQQSITVKNFRICFKM